MTSGSIEREVKLGGRPGFAMPDLDGVVAGLSIRQLPTLDLDATYYDTADLRLSREGVSLRRRTGDGAATWTLKLPLAPATASLRRLEFDVVDDATTIPEELRSIIRPWVRSAPVEPVIQILSHRQRQVLVDVYGAEVFAIDDDSVIAREGGEQIAQFREIEIELRAGGSVEQLELLTATMRRAGAGAPDPTPKVIRAIGPRAMMPSPLAPPDLRPQATIAEAVARAIRVALAEMIACDIGIRLGQDDRVVQRARSASRRIRADLKAFRDHIDATSVDHLRAELQWLSTELGERRIADVVFARITGSVESLSGEEVDAAYVLVGRARERRSRATAHLKDVLDSQRYVRLLDGLMALSDPSSLSGGERPPAVESIPEVMDLLWRRARRAVKNLPKRPSTDDIRGVRKQLSVLRSATLVAAPLYGAPASEFADRIQRVNSDLDTIIDARYTEEWIKDRDARSGSVGPAVIDRLVAAQIVEADAARRAWRESWDACRSRSLTRWFRA
ncbi:MAG: CYTH and CHAD domain-containing protein [Acidobacteria bacterium]|nr:CYTH and CHAD domain-containing protein [Acidobacteriota bacterium]